VGFTTVKGLRYGLLENISSILTTKSSLSFWKNNVGGEGNIIAIKASLPKRVESGVINYLLPRGQGYLEDQILYKSLSL